jgi:hypothetical protein
MDERDDRKPARAPRADRAERLKAALRANLKRRKAQARGRADQPECGTDKDWPHRPASEPEDR